MKYIVMLGDGMADFPVAELGNKTPLEVANKPYMDFLAKNGTVGMAKTVPDGMSPGSDVANLSVMGYDPEQCYTGRSPLEAVSIGIDLDDTDVTFRCNLVTLSDAKELADADMIDYSAGEISTPEATEIVNFLDSHFRTENIRLYAGTSYRHCLVLKGAKTGAKLTPPHDISKKPVKDHLPKGENAELLFDLMLRSRELLADHPVNKARIAAGKNPVTCCWFWGEGTKPAVSDFFEKYGLHGGVISAVDLIKGIGICAGHKVALVDNVTGNWDTNFKGKANAALDLLENGCDYVYIHVEGPDECGHHGDLEHKISSIESIDKEILGTIIPALQQKNEPFSILLMPDHPTPLSIMTHVSDPVPFVIYNSEKKGNGAPAYTEENAKQTGLYVEKACDLLNKMLNY